MKLRSWKNRPCPATTAARSRTGARLPCRRCLSPVPDLSWLFLPDETLVVFLSKLFDVPGCPAPQQKRADGNQQKQPHADDQGRLFHRIGSSQSCEFFSIGFVRPGSGINVLTFALPTRNCGPTLFSSKSCCKPRKQWTHNCARDVGHAQNDSSTCAETRVTE